jgi:hypothetical protein
LIKKVVAFSIVLLFVLNISHAFSQETPSFLKSAQKTKEYENNYTGLKFGYPETWTISADTGKDTYCDQPCLIVLSNKNDTNEHISILIKNTTSFIDACNCKSLTDFMKFQYSKMPLLKTIRSIQDNQTKISNGTDAWQMQFITPDSDINYILWFLKNNAFYEINYYSKPSIYSKHFPEIKAVIDSIGFNKLPNTEFHNFPPELPSFMKGNSTELVNNSKVQTPNIDLDNVKSDTNNAAPQPKQSTNDEFLRKLNELFKPSSIEPQPTTAPQPNQSNLDEISSNITELFKPSSIEPQPDTALKFDTTTTIQDIITTHDSGVAFDKYMAQVAANAQSPRATSGQISAWDYIKYSVKGNPGICDEENLNDPMNSITGMSVKGPCDIMMSFSYESCKGIPTLTECLEDKKQVDNYITTNNLMNKSSDKAYEFLELISARLNPSPTNTVDEMIFFSGDQDRNAAAYIKGVLSVR